MTVQLSHLDKVFFPDEGLRKGDLVGYYRMVAPRMLPYLRDRPVVMGRYPDGVTGEAILQKNVSRYFPDWVKRVEVERRGRGGAVSQVVCDKPETLIYLANQACIELHVLLSRVAALDRPDQLVFDLDPPAEEGFDDARRCALDLRRLLEEDLGLTAYVKTTGGKGLHVHVPLRADEGFDPVRDFARAVAELMVRHDPGMALPCSSASTSAETGSTSTCSATATPRWPSRPTRCGPGPGRRSPPRCTGPKPRTRT